MIAKLNYINDNLKPKNQFWKLIAKVGVFALSLVLKNQKGINPEDVDKGTEIVNKTLEQ